MRERGRIFELWEILNSVGSKIPEMSHIDRHIMVFQILLESVYAMRQEEQVQPICNTKGINDLLTISVVTSFGSILLLGI